MLDGFIDIFDNCTFESVDIAPCTPDDDIDIFDILAVLDAFQEIPFTDACPAPCN